MFSNISLGSLAIGPGSAMLERGLEPRGSKMRYFRQSVKWKVEVKLWCLEVRVVVGELNGSNRVGLAL